MSSIPRLFLPSLAPGSSGLELDPSSSRYLVKVLRFSEGSRFLGFDAQGREYDLELERADPQKARAKVFAQREGTSRGKRATLVLGQSLPKSSKMDLILRQGTELGVDRFIPLLTERSISRPDGSAQEHKQDRWGKILVEACRQCGRTGLPGLDPITPWRDLLSSLSGFGLVLMPYEKEAPSLRTALGSFQGAGDILVLVGPEGGWAKDEVAQAEERGALPVHLPTPILRTETAGLAVMSMIQYHLFREGGEP